MKVLLFLLMFLILPVVSSAKEIKTENMPDSVNIVIKSISDYILDSIHDEFENAIRQVEVTDISVGTKTGWDTLGVADAVTDSISITADAGWTKYGTTEYIVYVLGDTCKAYFTENDNTRIGPYVIFPNTAISDKNRFFKKITIIPFNFDNGIIENKIYVTYYINGR